MYRSVLIAGVAAAVLAGGFVSAPAQAAGYVTIRTISTKTVAYGGSIVIRPSAVAKRNVSVRSKRLSVKRGKSYVARNATSARLRAGTYVATTTVKYRLKSHGRLGRLRVTSKTQTLRIASKPKPIPKPTPKPAIPSIQAHGKPCVSSGLTKPGGAPWTCSFSEEFNGTTLDYSKWFVQETSTSGYQNNGECFINDADNLSVGNGVLSLTARREAEPFTCNYPGGSYPTRYSSGMVSTYGRFAQAYGRFEIRAKFPAAKIAGLQSALWLWPGDATKYGQWPGSGEIDIAEQYSQYPDLVIPYIHYHTLFILDQTVTNNRCFIGDVSAFHDYVAEWTTTGITISYDGKVCLTHTINPLDPLLGSQPFDQPFIVALTQAVGLGTNKVTDATPMPATTQVDYVRVWK